MLFMKNIIIILFLFINTKDIYPQNFFSQEPEVRVRIIDSLKELKVSVRGEWAIVSGDKSEAISANTGNILIKRIDDAIIIQRNEETFLSSTDVLSFNCISNSGDMLIHDVPYGVGWWWEGIEDRTYEGEINIYAGIEKYLEVVVKLPLEDYLKGVVPYEMGNDSPLESLKAQAVAARSEAIIALTTLLYSGENFDLTSDVECQVFSGNQKRNQVTDRAVSETRGLMLSEDGSAINAYYASNCGGHSENIKNVWPERPAPKSYQVALKDTKDQPTLDLSRENTVRDWIFTHPEVYCNPNSGVDLPSWSQKNFRWEKVFLLDSISQMIAGDRKIGSLLKIIPLGRGKSGRLYQARFVFEDDSFDVRGELTIRQLWHPALRSSCFVVDKKDDTFVLNGAGWGHGVGMCQTGAVAQAKQGANFEKILQHYYPKAELTTMY